METTLEKLRKKSDWLLTSLQDHPTKDDRYTITLNFSTYASLYATINDLMKVCTLALLTEEPHISPIVGNPNIDLANLLELAIQLMPKSEPEFLDEVKEMLKKKPLVIAEKPTYNFSTVNIVPSGAS